MIVFTQAVASSFSMSVVWRCVFLYLNVTVDFEEHSLEPATACVRHCCWGYSVSALYAQPSRQQQKCPTSVWTWRVSESCTGSQANQRRGFAEAFRVTFLTRCGMVLLDLICACAFFCICFRNSPFSALTLLVGHREEHLACKNWVMMC